VRFENIRERRSVVLDAFRFSESHALPAIDDIGPVVYSMSRPCGTPRVREE
jgi:hypothetical protein